MDDTRNLLPIFESYGLFRPLKTIYPFTLQLLFTVALEITAIVFAIRHPDENSKCREYFIIIYMHVGLWFFSLIVDQVVRIHHYQLRMSGYLEFYKKTQVHHRLPLYVISLWNAVILFIQVLMQHFYSDNFADKCIKSGLLSPISYIAALITIETCVIAGVNINYIVRVREFNTTQPPPDVQKEEWNACSSHEQFAQGEIGYRPPGDKIYDLIEKQADLIRHLKDHNAQLAEKLMVLNAQLQAQKGRRITNQQDNAVATI
ncbi:transmembrane protein 192 isoform X2 [Agrilus planipennis]|nr:transmembrane protein 192 isoform X2 [Agrilus planipennis]XP_018328910.1 transmembrane protein 192 isoform X2 [Agrilus planipennis]